MREMDQSHGRPRRPPVRQVELDDRAVITAEECFLLLGIDRSTGYRAIREGTLPVPVLRIGRMIRVPTAPLIELLRIGRKEAS